MQELNKIFEKYLIYFLFTGINPNDISDPSARKSVESGIMGMSIFAITQKIEVECNTNFKERFKNRDEKLFQDFYDLMCHELTHRGQFILRNHSNLSLQIDKERNRLLKDVTSITNLNISMEKKKELFNKLYMSNKYEIMSFANQIIEELRFNGMDDDSILTNLRTFSFREDDSMAMYDYLSLFDKRDLDDVQVLKRLAKCIHDYIKGIEKHNFDSTFTNIKRLENLKQEEFKRMKDIFKDYKEYKPLFEKTSKKITIKESIKKLKEAKAKLKTLKEDDAKEIEGIIDDLDTVITSAIDSLGSGDNVVSDLIDAAKDIEVAKDIAELEDGEEVIMAEEVEDDEKDKEEDDKEKVEEGEIPPQFQKGYKKGDAEKDDDKEDKKDDKKEESVNPYVSYFKK